MQIVLQCFTKRETRTHQKEPLALHKEFCFCFVWVCRTVGKAQNFFFLFAETSASLNLLFWRLPNHRQVVFYFSDVCRTIGKTFFIFPTFADRSAKLFFIFFRLPKRRQVTNFLFDVCRNLGKVQHLFLTLAEASANPFMLFCALLPPLLSVICSSTTGRWCGNGLRFWAKPLAVCADQYTSPAPLPCH